MLSGLLITSTTLFAAATSGVAPGGATVKLNNGCVSCAVPPASVAHAAAAIELTDSAC